MYTGSPPSKDGASQPVDKSARALRSASCRCEGTASPGSRRHRPPSRVPTPSGDRASLDGSMLGPGPPTVAGPRRLQTGLPVAPSPWRGTIAASGPTGNHTRGPHGMAPGLVTDSCRNLAGNLSRASPDPSRRPRPTPGRGVVRPWIAPPATSEPACCRLPVHSRAVRASSPRCVAHSHSRPGTL